MHQKSNRPKCLSTYHAPSVSAPVPGSRVSRRERVPSLRGFYIVHTNNAVADSRLRLVEENSSVILSSLSAQHAASVAKAIWAPRRRAIIRPSVPSALRCIVVNRTLKMNSFCRNGAKTYDYDGRRERRHAQTSPRNAVTEASVA